MGHSHSPGKTHTGYEGRACAAGTEVPSGFGDTAGRRKGLRGVIFFVVLCLVINLLFRETLGGTL